MLSLIATLLLLFPAGPPAKEDVPRFATIAEGFYRGGQPTDAGFEFLKQQGIKTIINLREENKEESMVRSLGMNSVHIPVSISFFSKIPGDAIEKYFEVLNDPANYPIFIHCRRGADRTGAMAGFYRVLFQDWDGKKAYDEARDIGMRWWYPGLKGQIKSFKTSSAALTLPAELPTFAVPAAAAQ